MVMSNALRALALVLLLAACGADPAPSVRAVAATAPRRTRDPELAPVVEAIEKGRGDHALALLERVEGFEATCLRARAFALEADAVAALRSIEEARALSPDHPELYATEVEIRSRVGIDRRPIDVTGPDGALLLESFVWADAHERIERLRKAVSIAAAEPPALVEGDYVDLLPRILAGRVDGALTVVYETSSLPYVEADRRAELVRVLEEAGASAPLAWLTTEPDEGRGSYRLVVRTWPEGEARIQYVLHKNVGMTWPMIDTPSHWISLGMDPDLDEAFAISLRQMIRFLEATLEMHPLDAYSLCSVAVTFRVTQTVDGNKGIHGMLAKDLFRPELRQRITITAPRQPAAS